MKGENTYAVLRALITALKVKLTSASIKAELDKHPEYYSFLGMSDVLRTFGVLNGVFELAQTQLEDLQVPFIAHLGSYGGEFVLVTHFSAVKVVIVNERYGHEQIVREWFNENYTGKVLVAETTGRSGEPGFRLKKRQQWLESCRGPFLLFGFTVILACLFVAAYPQLKREAILFCSLVLKLVGAIAALVLALKSIDVSNPLLNRLCSIGPRIDCNQVIYSTFGKITDELSWAEAGLLYFSSTFLALLFSLSCPGASAYLAALSLLSSLYVLYSLYLQAFILKQWCVFCILTLVVLALDAACLFSYLRWPFPSLPATGIWSISACLLTPAIVWAAVKPWIKAGRVLVSAREQLRDIKGRNSHLFHELIKGQPVLDLPLPEMTIMEGALSAPVRITIVSKPFCQACGDVHRELASWLDVRDDIQVQMVFYVLNYDGDIETAAATFLMQIYRELGPEQSREALKAWFAGNTKDLAVFVKQYPIKTAIDVSEELKVQQQWCLANDISATPMVFINGRQMPAVYKLDELKYFI